MIVTSYFDESGTHEGSPVTIMAAIMGTANQWAQFQRELDKLRLRYGFTIFHTKKFKAKSGEFAGWSNEKGLSLISEMSALTGNLLMHGCVFSLDNSAYEKEYKGGNAVRKLRLDSKYGLCFRICLISQVLEVIRRMSYHKKFDQLRMNIVAESGHKNAGDAERIYHEEAKELQRLGFSALSGITFADKIQCAPLMIADFLAHSTFIRDDKGLDPQPRHIPPVREKTGLTHLAFEPNGLALHRQALVKKLEARRAYGASLRQRSSAQGDDPNV